MPVFKGMMRTKAGFPPTIEMLQKGVKLYREARGYEGRGVFPFETVRRSLMGRTFEVPGKTYRIKDVSVHEIASPIYEIGDVEMIPELMVPGIAAAAAAYPLLGSGKKKEADGAATQAMRDAMSRISMRGVIKGGEGGGRDEMSREAALYLREPVGTGYGLSVDFLVDPLEVTNSAKPLNLEKGEYKGGEGWSPEMVTPSNWYPGYSGALSLMAAVNAGRSRKGGIRPCTDDLYLNKMLLPWQAANLGLTVNSRADRLVESMAEVFGTMPNELRAAALGRSRHTQIFKSWLEVGMDDTKIEKPTDGDSMFAWAIASGILNFGGLTGGVMEGVIGAIGGSPLGVNTTFQFVSHDKLKETKADADLLVEEHKFGFTEGERDKMIRSQLYDSEHVGSTIRRLSPVDPLHGFILDAANAEVDIPHFDVRSFLDEFRKVSSQDEKDREGVRFSMPSRAFLIKVLEENGYVDVRRTLRLGDFAFSRDGMYFVTAITPNKWAPLKGVKEKDGRIITESLFAGGSHSVAILEVESVEI